MKKYQANKSFYSENYQSYSSNDEFDLAKRVQITNEMPPQDMYDMAHSMIKNDLWKWFFGSSYLSYDIQYNESTDGKETVDSEGYLKEASIAKYVNGIRAKDYGPTPRFVWNPDYKKDYQEYVDFLGDTAVDDPYTEDNFKYKIEYPTYHRIEIDGALLPEVDLFLHEIYRYLGVLYPDHPDYNQLLTDNEFNDEIMQAGALIDYTPDFTYFEWLSKRLDYSNLDQSKLSTYYENEAAKLKIRNLLQFAFNRKLAGSKSGIRMFLSDIFQHVSIFPAAQYVPYLPFEKDNEDSNKSLDIKWYLRFYKKPDGFIARNIDKNHVLYKKQFRLIDWTNASYDFLRRYKEPAKFYGTAYPTPYSQFDLYEYPNQRVLDDKDIIDGLSIESLSYTMADDFKAGQKIKLNGQNSNWTEYLKGHIAYIEKEAGYSVYAQINDSATPFVKSTVPGKVVHIAVDTSVQPVYTTLKVFPSMKQLIEKIVEHDNLESVLKHDRNEAEATKQRFRIKWTDANGVEQEQDYLKSYYNSYSSLKDCLRNFYKVFYGLEDRADDRDYYLDEQYKFSSKILSGLSAYKINYRVPKTANFTLDPHQDGCLYLAPQQFLTTFEDNLNVSLDSSEWLDDENENPVSKIIYGSTSISDDGYVQKNDVLAYEDDQGRNFASVVLGISNAYLQFSLGSYLSSDYDSVQKVVDDANKAADKGISKYGIVVKLSDNNQYAGGKNVVFFGMPHFSNTTEVNGKYAVKSVYFDIKAIPRMKTHAQMLAIYPNFQEIADKKANALNTLVGKGSTNTPYHTYRTTIDNLQNAYSKFANAYDELVNALANDSLIYDDKHWAAFKKYGNEVIECLSSRHNLQRLLKASFDEFVETYDVLKIEILFKPNELKSAFSKISEQFSEYYNEVVRWFNGEIAIIVDCAEYELLKRSSTDFEYKTALNALDACDKTIFNSMLPNRSFLLTPLPDDLLMRDSEETAKKESSYSLLTGQDEFVSIIQLKINKYDDLLEWEAIEEAGSTGLLTNCLSYSAEAWSFGSLNTASIVASSYDDATGKYRSYDIDETNDFLNDKFSGTYLVSSSAHDATAVEFKVAENIEYLTISEKLQKLIDNDSGSCKFAYADPNFLEMFLSDDKKNNIQGEVLSYNKVKINCHFVEGSNEITFEEEAAINAMQYLSTGDQVIGKTIADDTFIEDIDIDNHKITVSNEMYVTDEAILTFLCRIQYEPDDISKDFYNYRIRASRKAQAEQGTLFAHSYQTDFSQFTLTPSIDLEEYRKSIMKAIQEQSEFRNSFNNIVKQNYSIDADSIVMPSTLNCEGNMLIDVNAYTKFEDDQYIMSQKTLDYVRSYLKDITRLSDASSLGVSINGYTKNDSKVSIDENIDSKFLVSNKWNSSYPVYIKIGTGRNDITINTEESKKESTAYTGDVYGDAVYGNAVYSTSQNENDADLQDSQNNFNVNDLAKPLFKSYIGEYELLKNVEFNNEKFTALQFAVMKRSISNLKKSLTTNISKNIFEKNVLKTFKAAYRMYTDDGNKLSCVEQTKVVKYLGEWDFDSKGTMPPAVDKANTEKIIYYYSIKFNCPVLNATDYDFLVYSSNDKQWKLKKFYFTGLVGEFSSNDVNINAAISNRKKLKLALLEKLFKNCGWTVSEKTEDGYVKSYKNKGLSEENCYLFEYVGQSISLNIPEKTYIGLIFNDGQFDICLFDRSLQLAKQRISKSFFVKADQEYTYLSLSSTNEGYLLSECLDDYKTSFDLNKLTNLVTGTFTALFDVKLNYTTTGHKYNEDNSTIDESDSGKVDNLNLTYNYFYPDDSNKKFYTYDKNGTKIAVDQLDNKYFKNIVNNITQFKTVQEVTNEGVIEKGELLPVEGFDFDADSLTLYDRILSLEKVNLRSAQDASLEPTFISKYTEFNGYLHSWDGSNLTISYKLFNGVRSKTAKNSFLYEINKLLPYDTTDSSSETNTYADDTLVYDESKFKGQTIYSPSIVDLKTYDEDDVDHYIKYFKNRLLLVGYVSFPLNDDGTIALSFKHTNALTGLSKLAINDTLEQTALLEPLNATAYTKYEAHNTNLGALVGVGYKFGIFYEFYTNHIDCFRCTSISNLDNTLDNRPSTEATTYSVSNYKIVSFAWDEDINKWILTTSTIESNNQSTESQGGLYSCIALDGSSALGIVLEDLTAITTTLEDGSIKESHAQPADVNTYQLLTVNKQIELLNQEEKGTEESLQSNKKFLARDIAFANLSSYSEKAITFDDLTIGNNSSIAQLDKISFDNNASSYEGPYKTLSFEVEVPKKPTSLKFSSNETNFYYYYNNELNRWEQFLTSDNAYVFKNLSNASNDRVKIKAKIYLCPVGSEDCISTFSLGKPILYNEYSTEGVDAEDQCESQYLWALPRPIDDNCIYFAMTFSDNNPEFYFEKHGNSSVTISNLTLTSSVKINNDFNYRNFLYPKDATKKMYIAANNQGHMAALNGEWLFVKSEKKYYTIDGDNVINGEKSDYKYWTLAHIPAMKDISYEYLNNLDVDELYDLVSGQLQLYLNSTSGENLTTVEQERFNTLSKITLVSPEDFIDTIKMTSEEAETKGVEPFDYTYGLTLSGIKYVETSEGRVPVFCSDKDKQKTCFEQYSIPINVTVEGGRTTAAYLRRETYVSYLRDFYNIALGCANMLNLTESGIKYFGIDEHNIQIITKNSDILVLPIDQTYSRDAIENAANWNLKSIAPSLEVPYYEDIVSKTGSVYPKKTLRGMYDGDGNETWEYAYSQMTYVVKKFYDVQFWLSKDQIETYVGTVLKADDSLPDIVKNALNSYYKDGSIDYNDAFIAYSNDGGSTYSFSTAKNVSSDVNNTSGLKPLSAYFIDDEIRILLASASNGAYTTLSIAASGSTVVVSNSTNSSENNSDMIATVADNAVWQSAFFLEGSISCSVFNNCYFLSTIKAINEITGIVTAISNGTVTVQPSNSASLNELSVDSAITVKALFSFNTTESIQNQAQYIDYMPELFDSYGKFKVDKTSVVDTYNTANLAYSRNENYTEGKWDPTYYPCVEKDKNSGRNVYNYTAQIDEEKSITYSQVDAVNDFGEYIYLYDEPSNCVLFERNSNKLSTKKSLEDIVISGDIDITDAERMASVRTDYKFIYNDDSYYNDEAEVEGFAVRLNNVKLQKTVFNDASSDRENYIVLNCESINSILDKAKDDSTLRQKYFYTWPKELIAPSDGWNWTDKTSSFGFGEAIEGLTASEDEPFIAKLKQLQKNDVYLTVDALSSFDIKPYSTDDGDIFVKNTKGEYLLNEKAIYLLLSMTYNAKNSQYSIYANKSFSLTDDVIDDYGGNPVNSIYIDPVGYGGILNNNDFSIDWPWTLDNEAYKTALLKNTKGEYVYLSDELGNNLENKNGLFLLKKNSSVVFSYDKLAKNKNVVSLRKEDNFAVDDYTNALQYIVYKIDNTAPSIYVPCTEIRRPTKNDTRLTFIKVYRDNFDCANEVNADGRYRLAVSSNDNKFYANADCIDETYVDFYIEGNYLKCSKQFYVKDDTLVVQITDSLDNSSSSVSLKLSDSAFLVSLSNNYQYYDESSSGTINVAFDTDDNVFVDLSSESNNVLIETSGDDYKLTLQNDGAESIEMTATYVTDDEETTSSAKLYLDVRKLQPKLYVNKASAQSSSEIQAAVYDGASNITSSYEIAISEKDQSFLIAATSTVNGSKIALQEEVTKADKPFEEPAFITSLQSIEISLSNAQFIYLIDSPDEKLQLTDDDRFIIDGAPGSTMMIVPKYTSFSSLVSTLGRVISKNDFIYLYNDAKATNDLLKLSYIDYTYLYLSSLKLYDQSSLNDIISSTDYLKIKILPLNSVLVDTTYMNNPDYYTEVPLVDIDTFSYDRVWINEDVYLAPVVNIDGVIYNSSNFSQYSTSLWQNKDSIPVYLCDEQGHFVKQDTAYKTSLHYEVMGDELGNCSADKYQSVDPRLNPYTAQYETAYDYFYSNYYSDSELCNPFVKHIEIKDAFIDGKWQKSVASYVRRKVNGVLKNYEDSTVDASKKSFTKTNDAFVETDIVDYNNGLVTTYLTADNASTDEYLTLAGIKYSNPFSSSSFTLENCLKNVDVNCKLSFDIDSVEDPANLEKSCIVDITEMGIFDKNDNMIAYMTHPIAQYDTSKNHIAYNLLIKED